MRLVCNLRSIRGKRAIRDVAEASGISRGELSRIERGYQLPRDDQIPALERAYAAPHHSWWPPAVLAALSLDPNEDA